MGIAERAAERAVGAARERATGEVRALVEAGLAVLRRKDAAGLTVADVLDEAGLSTRAFYRHFASKDELLLAIYEHDTRATQARLGDRLDAAGGPRAALDVWIDETLGLAFDARRARRTRPLAREGMRLEAQFPAEFAAIVSGMIDPLTAVLAAGRVDGTFPSTDPARDARSIHALTWAPVEEHMHDPTLTLDDARAQVLRFCLPALGAPA